MRELRVLGVVPSPASDADLQEVERDAAAPHLTYLGPLGARRASANRPEARTVHFAARLVVFGLLEVGGLSRDA